MDLEGQFQSAVFGIGYLRSVFVEKCVVTFSPSAIPEAATSCQKEIRRTAKSLEFRLERTRSQCGLL